MPPRLHRRFFWSVRPLFTLTGAGLLVTASSRTAFALLSAGALVWVYALTILVYVLAGPLFPKQGKETALLFVSSFWGSLYFFLFSLVSPLLALETAFFIILSPVTCVASGLVKRLENLRLKDALIRACLEALTLGGALLGLALIREPLGFGTLSLPGGSEGIVEFFGGGGEVFPVRVIGSSAGAFLLIGYGMALFRRVKRKRLQEDAS